jgi:alginate O-acetyltransferase complex protein AlgI
LVFCSFQFALLFVLTFVVYYLPFMASRQPTFIMLVSLFFYAQSEPTMLYVMVISALFSGVVSYLYRGKIKSVWLLRSGLALNLGLLCFFKYPQLIYDTLLAGTIGRQTWHFLRELPLPAGISFYTFHNMSLMVDSYFARNKPQKIPLSLIQHLRNTLLYTDFFPQLVAGPIVKWNFFSPQIGLKKFSEIEWLYCARCLILGYFLKLFVADNLADILIWFRYPYFLEKSSLTLFVSLCGYSLQIFADFAGYSLIALGLAGLLGYQLPENFNAPFLARNPSEFWTRWHITLSQWLKQYLFNPLVLRAKRRGKMGVSAFLAVMVLGGLWHGASWNFVIWGINHGVLLIAVYFYQSRISVPTPAWLGRLMMFGFISFNWVFFAISDFNHAMAYLHTMATNVHVTLDPGTYLYTMIYGAPVLMLHGWQYLKEKNIAVDQLMQLEPVLHAVMLFLMIFDCGGKHGFVYFQF